jgi:mono/diheme cytochrome c family protein/HEAT repeat protein
VHAITIVDDGVGHLSGKNTFPRGEFLASSDERFRPAMSVQGPDGNIYVVDVYRGVVQDAGIWSEYLQAYIRTRHLQLPVGRGRIWRVVYGNAPATPVKPGLSTATPAQLVQTLSNPDGWWRDTAQRILVERGDKSVAPALTALATTAPSWKTKLHALWTLDGIDAIEPATIEKALTDTNSDVRAAAIRISERWLREPNSPMAASVLKLIADKSFTVRRQLAASIGEMPAAARVAPLTTILTNDGNDEIIVDAAVSSLKGLEAEVLDRMLQARAGAKPPAAAVEMLAAAVVKGGDQMTAPTAVLKYLDTAADATKAAWLRLAVLEGVDDALPGGGGGRGGGGLAGLSAPGGRVAVSPRQQTVTLAAEPASLAKLTTGTGDLSLTAKSVWNKLNWPGRNPVVVVTPLSAVEQKRYAAGEQIFKGLCAGCHGEDGRGKPNLGGNLVDSTYVNGSGCVRARFASCCMARKARSGSCQPLRADVQRRADRVGAHLRPSRLGAHRLARGSQQRDGAPRHLEDAHHGRGLTPNCRLAAAAAAVWQRRRTWRRPRRRRRCWWSWWGSGRRQAHRRRPRAESKSNGARPIYLTVAARSSVSQLTMMCMRRQPGMASTSRVYNSASPAGGNGIRHCAQRWSAGELEGRPWRGEFDWRGSQHVRHPHLVPTLIEQLTAVTREQRHASAARRHLLSRSRARGTPSPSLPRDPIRPTRRQSTVRQLKRTQTIHCSSSRRGAPPCGRHRPAGP